MKRRGFLKRKSRIRPKSAKRRKLDEETREEREAWQRDNALCFRPNCGRAGSDCHEVEGGIHRHVTRYAPCAWLHLCRTCHDAWHAGKFGQGDERAVTGMAWKLLAVNGGGDSYSEDGMSSEHRCEVIEIGEVEKHPNADTLSITKVHGGYPVIFRTGEYEPGSKAVYVPVDSVVPAGEPRWEFLGEHRRIKARKLRGVFSMGLLTQADPTWPVGECVRDRLGIVVYEPQMKFNTTGGDNEPDPGYMPCYTDIDALRRYKHLIQPNEEVVATEKIHGANGRYLYRDGRLWCGSRTGIKREAADNMWWQVATQFDFADRLKACEDIAIYGEVYGTVQDLRYGVKNVAFVAFDALDTITRRYLDYDEFSALAARLDLPVVPSLYRGLFSGLDVSLAEGNSVLANGACIREGFVVRPVKERFDDRLGRVILKYHGEGYLTRK